MLVDVVGGMIVVHGAMCLEYWCCKVCNLDLDIGLAKRGVFVHFLCIGWFEI